MRASYQLPPGRFHGGELEPGTFHHWWPDLPENDGTFLATEDNLPRDPEKGPPVPVEDPEAPSNH